MDTATSIWEQAANPSGERIGDMEEKKTMEEIVDQALKDITHRVAHIELRQCADEFDEKGKVCSLSVAVGGEYTITIIYNAEEKLMRTIAEHMKRAPVADFNEIAMYTKEYFNILCGHVVVAINRQTHSSARFGIPDFSKGVYSLNGQTMPLFEICYQSAAGVAQIRGVCDASQPLSRPLKEILEEPKTAEEKRRESE